MALNLKESRELSSRVVLSAIFGNGLLGIFKFAAWLVSGSPSILAEGIHSVADTANQILLHVGLKQSRHEATPEHPWGYGNASYLWNLISALGVFILGFGVTTYHGFYSLLNPQDYTSDWLYLKIGVLIIALIIESTVLSVAVRATKKLKKNKSLMDYIKHGDDPTTVAVLLEDSVAVFGLMLAFVGIFISEILQNSIPDALASICIGFLLGLLAILLVKQNSKLLIGVSAQPATQDEIKCFLEKLPSIERVTDLRTEILGPGRLRLSAEIEFHGERMINREQIIRDAEKVRSGEAEVLPILVETASRMVRTVGNEINRVERKLIEEFPQLQIIELEVN